MRVAILAAGTRGDIQPMLAIGHALAQRGHSVVLTVNTNLAPWARRSGLEVVETEPDYERYLKSAEGQRLQANHDLATFGRELAALETRVNDALGAACVRACRGADLIVSSILLVYRGHCIAEHMKVPHGCAATFPVHPDGAFACPLFPLRDLRVPALNRATFFLVYHMLWKQWAPNIQAMRASVGLAPLAKRARVEELPAALLCSDRLVPVSVGRSASVTTTGMIGLSRQLRERLGEARVPDDLERWLAAGPPPIFFGFGSLPVLDPASMLQQIADIARRHQTRALVGAGWSGFASHGELPAHVFVAPAIDHDQVLPRCRAAVHHGGAGTTATVARAGIPAAITSVFSDQPFWGWSAQRAGVATTQPFQKLTPRSLEKAIAAVLDDGMVRRARALGEALRREDGAARAAAVIESWGRGVVPAPG